MKKEVKNIFQQSFDGYESAVDTQDLLAGIAAKRKKKNDRNGAWWLFPAGLLVAGIVAMVSFYGIDSQTVRTQQQAPNSHMEKVVSAVTPVLDKTVGVDELSTAPMTRDEALVEQKASAPAEAADNNERSLKPQKSVNNTIAAASSENKKVDVPELLGNSADERISDTSDIVIATTESKVHSRATVDSSHKETRNDAVRKKVLIKKQIDGTQPPITSVLDDIGGEFSDLAAQEHAKHDPVLDDGSEVEKEALTAVAEEILDVRDLADKKGIAIKLLIGGGLLSSGFGNTDLGAQRKAALSQSFSFNGQLKVTYNIYKDFNLATGLEYNQYNQLYQWSGQYVTDRDGAYIGPIVPPSFQEDDYLFVEVNREIVQYNARVFLDVPFSLSWRRQFGRLAIEPSVSASFNIYDSHNGYTINREGIPQRFSDFNYTVSPKYGIAIDIDWSIADRLGVVTRAALSRRKISDRLLDENIVSPELNVGVRYGL